MEIFRQRNFQRSFLKPLYQNLSIAWILSNEIASSSIKTLIKQEISVEFYISKKKQFSLKNSLNKKFSPRIFSRLLLPPI